MKSFVETVDHIASGMVQSYCGGHNDYSPGGLGIVSFIYGHPYDAVVDKVYTAFGKKMDAISPLTIKDLTMNILLGIIGVLFLFGKLEVITTINEIGQKSVSTVRLPFIIIGAVLLVLAF